MVLFIAPILCIEATLLCEFEGNKISSFKFFSSLKSFIGIKTLQFYNQSIQTEQEIEIILLLITYMCWGYNHLTIHNQHIS